MSIIPRAPKSWGVPRAPVRPKKIPTETRRAVSIHEREAVESLFVSLTNLQENHWMWGDKKPKTFKELLAHKSAHLTAKRKIAEPLSEDHV